MAASISLKSTENCVLGEVDTYSLTWIVSDAQEIDPNIFIVEYTKNNPRINKYTAEFHHVAYLPEMESVKTALTNESHQYIRQSSITRTYASQERMEESKKVMLNDIKNLLKAYNTLKDNKSEQEILITAEGYQCTLVDTQVVTINGEEVRW
jgi:hypothetical protein